MSVLKEIIGTHMASNCIHPGAKLDFWLLKGETHRYYGQTKCFDHFLPKIEEPEWFIHGVKIK